MSTAADRGRSEAFDRPPVPPLPPAVPPLPPAAPPPVPPVPWLPIAVGTPGPEFEARPPGRYAFEFPDTECDGWSAPSLCLRFASVRGAQHRYSGKPRQDAARAACHEASGSVVFAVADGVSGATRSEWGAIEACRTSVERMLHLLSAGGGPLDFRDVLLRSAERLRQLAQWSQGGREPEPGEVAALYATTLVAGVVRPDPAGPVAELCRVGDSGAWVLDRSDGRYHALFGPETGSDSPLVSNVVTPLPHVPDPLELTVVRLEAPHTLLVGTDGFGDPLGDGDGQVGALFARQLATPVPSPWLAHLLDFSRETFDDDRTLLAVWPHPGAPAT
ncbi:protein phosphatase 2C domain-containing protein [Streptomyces sp. NPDC093260]|uniref:protein phosphatase 2C domain-containing protein n=1 Tax=Streptomyces sp. NPDC093260 TaxID=3155073 RepID=UPI00344AC3CB